jgi:protoporphyrin/coproporphyrin ferrochelatase
VKHGVLLLAHGAPERIEDVAEYLACVRAGRPGNPAIVEEVKHRYAAIGGASPLLRWTRAQAEALGRVLGIPVYFGMRNWRPFIREAMERIREDGIERLAAICLAPQYSKMSVGLYFRRTQEAKTELGVTADIVWAKSFHRDPLLIDAFAEKAGQASRHVPDRPGGLSYLFTAHSLPEKILDSADPYDRECRATAAAVAARAGIPEYEFAYQSQGFTDDKWLGPTVEATLDGCAARGVREVVLHPIGFVSDHVEILFDVDVLFRRYAEERGIALRRPESLNDSPKFTAALAEVAQRCLA